MDEFARAEAIRVLTTASNDRADAEKLAKLLYLDAVPQVHVPSADVRAWRGLVEYRRRLVDRRVAVKNQVRALLRGLGVAGVPSGARNRSRNWPASTTGKISCPNCVPISAMIDETSVPKIATKVHPTTNVHIWRPVNVNHQNPYESADRNPTSVPSWRKSPENSLMPSLPRTAM